MGGEKELGEAEEGDIIRIYYVRKQSIFNKSKKKMYVKKNAELTVSSKI